MSVLKGNLLNSNPEQRLRTDVHLGAGGVALKGSLAPELGVEDAFDVVTITNRDSGISYVQIGRVEKSDGRVTLRFEATDGSGTRVTLPESRLQDALALPEGAWSINTEGLVN